MATAYLLMPFVDSSLVLGLIDEFFQIDDTVVEDILIFIDPFVKSIHVLVGGVRIVTGLVLPVLKACEMDTAFNISAY